MKTEALNFDLPDELIARFPAEPRDTARLMMVDRRTDNISASTFRDIGNFLKPGDVLVFNETKVFPARIYGLKPTGGKVEVVFLAEVRPKVWEVIFGGRAADETVLCFDSDFSGRVTKNSNGNFLTVNLSKTKVYQKLENLGQMPLPPYLRRTAVAKDKVDYQSVFAKRIGSAAAPTASLHFTKKLLASLKNKGVQVEYITLHVGLGTFAPVKTEKLEDHPIHSEQFEIEKGTAERLNQAKKEGRRIIACGTTVVRTLEAASQTGKLLSQKTDTRLFIYPGYKFKFVDGIITNFHTPKSSLLALVYAFAGQDLMQQAYQRAINEKYRFYSYGDGMLII